MSALPRPDLPPGPLRDLVADLHDLHHRDGWRSLRTLARATGVSHTTVSKAFSSGSLPPWGTVELLVEAMGGDRSHFHDRWLAASATGDLAPPTPRIAGRRVELDVVRGHLEAGRGLVLVTGEAGIGKTTLLRAAASATPTCTAVGNCLPLSGDAPLTPVIDVLLTIQEVDGGAWFADAVRDLPAHVLQSLGHVLPQLGARGTDAGLGDFARQHLFTSIRTLLERLAALRPLAVVLEDLHWADTATLDLVEHLTLRSPRVPLVGSWRSEDDATPHAGSEWFTRLHRHPDVRVLRLGPLSRDETAEQLAILGTSPAADIDRIHSRTLGQPLFTEQLASTGDSEGLPLVLADLLDRRLRGLTDTAWAVMRTLGLAERALTTAQLAASTGVPARSLTEHLRDLTGRRLLLPGTDDLVHLQHPLLADATKRRLVPGEAAQVHAGLATVLGDTADAAPTEVAHHWERAGDRDRELEWRVRAARDAAAVFDWSLEADSWLRVLDLWPPGAVAAGDPPVTLPEAYLAAVDSLKASLQWDRAADLCAAAEAALGEADEVDDLTRAELLRRSAEFRGEREGVAVGLELVDAAVDLFARCPPGAGYVRALDDRSALLREFGRYDEALEVTRSAVGVAAGVSGGHALRHLLTSLAWQEGIRGASATASRLLAEGQALFPDGTDPIGDIRSAVIASDVLLVCGRPLDEVREVVRPGQEAARTWGIDSEGVMILTSNLGLALLRAGEVGEAGELLGADDDRPPDPDRWPLDSMRAVVETCLGRLDVAAARSRVAASVGPPDEIDLETLHLAVETDVWRHESHVHLPRLLRELDTVVDSAPVRVVLPALVMAARAAADDATTARAHAIGSVHDLARRASLDLGQADSEDPHVAAHLAAVRAELDRAADRDQSSDWALLAARWDALGRPHDAAYSRWRAARAALREGRGTLAARLLRQAAADAREHVPLREAIAAARAATA